jgi:trimeric autotransporter adhesin
MRQANRRCSRLTVLALMLSCTTAAAALAQTTAFTYQGQLSAGDTLASGSYDVRFALFDSAMNGTQIGTDQTVPAISISDGVFTVKLDFGVNAFPGADRFVEISVRPTGTSSFSTLAPRQQISSTPYAIRTLSAATADGLSSACVGCVQSAQINSVAGSKVTGTIPAASVPSGSGNYIQNSSAQQPSSSFNISGNGVVGGNLTVAGTLNANLAGNFIQNGTAPQAANFNVSGNGTVGGLLSAGSVGIGTSNPVARLAMGGSGVFNAPGAARFDLVNSTAHAGYLQHVTDDGSWQIATTAGATRMIIDPTGNVGIGNSSAVRLFVSGGPAWTSASWHGSLGFDNASAIGWAPNNAGQQFGIGQTNGGLYFFRTVDSFGETSAPINYDMFISDSGTVGIGTTSPAPATTLHAVSSAINGNGVFGQANNGSNAYGVWGQSTTGIGVYGEGLVYGVYGKANKPESLAAVYADGDLRALGNAYVNGAVTAAQFIPSSDRNAKANFSDVAPRAILAKLAALPIQTWNFKTQPESERHLGPTAQDFRAAFELGQDDTHISTTDADGVALAAIQGLYQIVQEKDRQLQQLRVVVRQLEHQVRHKPAGRGS